MRDPPHTHNMPPFVVPRRALGWSAGALARRSAQRVRGLEGKQRKMVTELKVSQD